jgi:histidinol dehydrogenase
MKTIISPPKSRWEELCKRPLLIGSELEETVKSILYHVRTSGDMAVLDYSVKYDKIESMELKVSEKEFTESEFGVPEGLKSAINTARENIEKFHLSQLDDKEIIETMPGVKCWRESTPIEKVGLYIPGGTAPLFSTILMLGIPARIAGCNKIILCTPPDKNGRINPVILYTAGLLGIFDIFKIGGAQAIAAMAYGTETVPKVNKIFGPGNQYVNKAKELVQRDGIAIDIPAGPSEVLVIADRFANPQFIAADLLSQAEHGIDSQVVFLTDYSDQTNMVMEEIEKQLIALPRRDIAAKALENSMSVIFNSLNECMEFSNSYAPEHLIINTREFESLSDKVVNAGSVFLGQYSCESAGDYASGTNHTLPTNGFATCYSGVSVDSFVKKITFQELSRNGIIALGPVIQLMAEAEDLKAHGNAVEVRIKSFKT